MKTIPSILTTIRNHRIAANYSQEYMAHCIGISQAAYCKIESGKTELKITHLFKIVEILKLEINLTPPPLRKFFL